MQRERYLQWLRNIFAHRCICYNICLIINPLAANILNLVFPTLSYDCKILIQRKWNIESRKKRFIGKWDYMQIPLATTLPLLRYRDSKFRVWWNRRFPRGQGKLAQQGMESSGKYEVENRHGKEHLPTNLLKPPFAISTISVRNFYAFYIATWLFFLFNFLVHAVLLAPTYNRATQDEIAAYLMGL